jgi:hypothetical protein
MYRTSQREGFGGPASAAESPRRASEGSSRGAQSGILSADIRAYTSLSVLLAPRSQFDFDRSEENLLTTTRRDLLTLP